MALSKLVIGLIVGVISVGAIGGITAAVVTSNNRNAVNTVEEEKIENSEDKKPSITDNRNRTETRIDELRDSSKENNEKSEVTSESKQMDKRNKENNSFSSRLEENQTGHEMVVTSGQDEVSKKVEEEVHIQKEGEVEKNDSGMVTPSAPNTVSSPEKAEEQDPNAAVTNAIEKGQGREEGAKSVVEEEEEEDIQMQHEPKVDKRTISIVEKAEKLVIKTNLNWLFFPNQFELN